MGLFSASLLLLLYAIIVVYIYIYERQRRRVARSILSTGFTTFGSGCQKTIPENYDRSVL